MNRCDDCGDEIRSDDGAFCGRCTIERYWARFDEYWEGEHE